MAELVASIWNWLWRKEKSSAAFEGFNLLTGDQRKFNQQVLEELEKQRKRLDECDNDRAELRNDVSELNGRVQSCEDDREDLRQQLNRHSIEFKSALGISPEPKPPRRTTHRHTDTRKNDAENE